MPQGIRHPLAEPRNISWIGLTIISVTLFVATVQVGLSIRDLQMQLAAFEQLAANGDGLSPARLRSSLASVKNDMAVIRADAGWLLPLLPALGWLPQVGGDLSQADALFGMSDALVSAAEAGFSAWSPQLEPRASTQAGQPQAELDQTIADARPTFLLARAYLAQADKQRARIHTERLSVRTAAILERLERATALLQLAVEGSLALPELLGSREARHYLIVAQNEDERRATGGFVSAAGLLSLEHGRITGLEFMDSYQVDDLEADFPPAPEPIQTYMLGGYWLFRDANWSADFPSSARQLAAFYEMGKHRQVDAVIGVDQEMVRLLVQAAGTLEVPSEPPLLLSADNLVRYMRESWAPPANVKLSTAFQTRKSFMGDLAKALQERIQNGDKVNKAALAKAVYDGLRGRHLLVYLPDSPLGPALARTGWDGALQAQAGDFVMVVDSNLGFNKANALVAQAYDYAVTIAADQSVQAALQISYQHLGKPSGQPCPPPGPEYDPSTTYASVMNRCLWDYLRVYVPAGSRLSEATRFPIPAQQMLNRTASSGEPQVAGAEGKTSTFAAFFVVGEGEHKEFRFGYQLPAGTLQRTSEGMWRYALYWQKQPGTPAIPLRLVLTLPPGAVAQRSSPVPAALVAGANSASGTQLKFALEVSSDLTLEVLFR